MSLQPVRLTSGSTPLSLWRREDELHEPSQAVVAAVLAFGDVRQFREDGALVIRLSAERASRDDMTMLLQDEAPRAVDVSVVFREERLSPGAPPKRAVLGPR